MRAIVLSEGPKLIIEEPRLVGECHSQRLKLVVKQARLVGYPGDNFSKAVIEQLLLVLSAGDQRIGILHHTLENLHDAHDFNSWSRADVFLFRTWQAARPLGSSPAKVVQAICNNDWG